MDNPGDAKYGMTHEQIIEAFKILKSKGVKHFGIHSFLASNTVTNEYYPTLAKILFELAVELKEKQEQISSLSIFQAVSALITSQSRKRMIFQLSVPMYTRYMMKY